jgi:hypothetical protein
MYGKVREVEAAETGNCSILDDKPIRLNLGETREDTDQICQLVFTYYGVQGDIEFHPMPMSVFPQSGYLLQGEIGCEGSSAVMAMPHINGVSSMLQGGEKALYIAGRCEQFWVISLLWKGFGHWVPRYAERIAQGA